MNLLDELKLDSGRSNIYDDYDDDFPRRGEADEKFNEDEDDMFSDEDEDER